MRTPTGGALMAEPNELAGELVVSELRARRVPLPGASASATTAGCRSCSPRRGARSSAVSERQRARARSSRATPRGRSSRSPAPRNRRRPSSSPGLLLEEGIPSMIEPRRSWRSVRADHGRARRARARVRRAGRARSARLVSAERRRPPRRGTRRRAGRLDQDRLAGVAGDRPDLLGGALELGVGEDRACPRRAVRAAVRSTRSGRSTRP